MMSDPSGKYLQFLLLMIFIIPSVFFLLTQQRTLELIRPAIRRMRPGLVWLQFIPIFGLIWQFIVISRISDSIRNELNTPADDSIFAEDVNFIDFRPTFNVGISYAFSFCLSLMTSGLIKNLTSLVALILWIIYWVQLSGYKKKLKERALLNNS